ncbi:hypothetical protein NDU88_002433 [Pleurodeles waltl]|uniref:Uncharacterized protein n=1 Tax=Pleurodeles waltl TaxID=8319 RepID=A0AAV7SF63_PLEWA|nr:hypothetical protein NDU88_002433 [Pleurodeles waltl]
MGRLVIRVQGDRAAVITGGLFWGWDGHLWTLRGDVVAFGCVYFELSNVVVFCNGVCILTAAVCTANGIPRLKDRCRDLRVGMVWAYFCWRDGGGLVIASFLLTFGVADFCGCRVFGGLPVAGQNDRGGLPQPWWCYGGLLAGGMRLLPPRSE